MPIRFGVKLENKIPEMIRRMQKRSLDNLLGAAMVWHDEIVNGQLSGSRSGRKYRIPGTRRYYHASRPGEPPASRTGTLRSGYRFRVVDRGPWSTGEVGSPENYALWLEKGTSKMAKRPHVEPAFDKREADIKKELSRRWDR